MTAEMGVVEGDFKALILSDATLAALLTGGLWLVQAPQNTSPPFATFQRIDTVPDYVLDGSATDDEVRFQVDVFAKDAATIHRAANLLRRRLEGFSGWVGQTQFKSSSMANNRPLFEQESLLWRLIQDWKICHG